MKKHTLINTLYDAEKHAYLITIGTDIGEFSGTAQCRAEDYEHESKFFGFELAEIKANIAYAKAKRAYWDAQAKALTSFWRSMADTRSYNESAFWVKHIRSAVENALEKRDYWAQEVRDLKEFYRADIVAFDLASKKRRTVGVDHD